MAPYFKQIECLSLHETEACSDPHSLHSHHDGTADGLPTSRFSVYRKYLKAIVFEQNTNLFKKKSIEFAKVLGTEIGVISPISAVETRVCKCGVEFSMTSLACHRAPFYSHPPPEPRVL